MKTVQVTVYSFNELSEQAQQKAIANLYDINVDYSWWDSVCEDAKNIGLKIEGFDIDRGSYVEGKLIKDFNEVVGLILSEHGSSTKTYKLALEYRSKWDDLVLTYSDGENTSVVAEDNEYEFDKEADELEESFLKDLCEEYLVILRNEYEYLTSEEAIKETIEANNYQFTEDGELF